MGILAPLFLAGLAALGAPLLLHLVRRTPRGRQEFSSLLFLSPTPPRLTRRSRLEQIFLLLLRLGALALLAAAFARPFLREATLLTETDLPKRRVAILVDASASMQRGDLWKQVRETVERELDELTPQDEVALFTFTEQLHAITPFATDNLTAADSSADLVRSQVRTLSPTQRAGDLGRALATLAAELDAADDVRQSQADAQIIVVSDFAAGNRIDALTAFEWPTRVRIIPKVLAPKATTNAAVQLLANRDDTEDVDPRVRVTNAANSTGDQFFVRWGGEKAKSPETAVYVPPGQSRVIKLPRPEGGTHADRVTLRGDDHDFDNSFYVVPPRTQEVTLAYAGDDAADDPEGLRYYLGLATTGDPLRQVTIRDWSAESESSAESPLVVITKKLTADQLRQLERQTENGGVLLLVLRDDATAAALAELVPDVTPRESKPSREGDFALLGEIDFTHPLFLPFAGPRYNDFTKIHFWRHRKLGLVGSATTRVVARFDNGDPWLLERAVGKGRVFTLTSDWSPEDSQLALSTKFVPLIGKLLDLACGSTKPSAGLTVGDASPGDNAIAESPGVFATSIENDRVEYAVNLAASESDTAPMQLERLDQLGVRRTVEVSRDERLARIRQARDVELEGRQKVWRWLLVGCILLIMTETFWAGRSSRPLAPLQETPA